MVKEQEKALEQLQCISLYGLSTKVIEKDIEAIEIVLNLIQEQQAGLEKKDKIINDSINKIEEFRQHFDDSLQPDFIMILEILKDKNVITW